MGKFPIDLSKFKKESSDSRTSTLVHPSGHKFIISHSSLSPKMRADIAAMPVHKKETPVKMAEGGKIPGGPGSPAIDDDKAKNMEVTGSGDPIYEAVKSRVKKLFGSGEKQPEENYAKGGEVQKYAEGSPDGIQDIDYKDLPESTPQQTHPPVIVNVNGNQPAAPTSTEQPQAAPPVAAKPSGDTDQLPPGIESGEDLYNYIKTRGASAPMAGTPQPTPTPIAQPASIPPSPAVAAAAQAPETPSYIQQGLNSEMAGLQDKYLAEKEAASGKQKALLDAQNQYDVQGKAFDDHVDTINAERAAILDDLKNSHIDPNHFWNSKDTVGKIGTMLGLLVGGFAGPNNQTSKFIDDQISRDVDAQKANINNKQGVLSALREQFHDVNTASQFHRVLLNDQVSHAIDLASAKAATPMAKANLEMAKGQLLRQSGVLMAQIGAKQTLNTPGVSTNAADKALNTLRMVDPAAAKEAEERYVPGIGMASVPVPPAIREQIVARNSLNVAATDLLDFIKNKGSSMSVKDRALAAEKANVVQSLYREGLLKTVYKQGEQPLLDKVVSEQPLSFVNRLLGTEATKLKEVINSNQRGLNTVTNSYGFKLSPAMQGKVSFTPGK